MQREQESDRGSEPQKIVEPPPEKPAITVFAPALPIHVGKGHMYVGCPMDGKEVFKDYPCFYV